MRLLLQEDVVLPSSSFRRRLAIVLPLLRHDLAGSAHRHRHGTAMCRICVAHPSLVQACGVCFDACRSVQMGCTPIDAAGLVSDFRGHTKAKHPACRGGASAAGPLPASMRVGMRCYAPMQSVRCASLTPSLRNIPALRTSLASVSSSGSRCSTAAAMRGWHGSSRWWVMGGASGD